MKAKSEALGLRLNVSKTKIMIVGSDGNEDPIVVDGTEVEHVTQFNFLGSLITTSSGCSTELRRRMAMAKSAMVGLNKIWTDRGITKATKKHLVSALIFPIATYGWESWTLTKADQSRITSFEMWCWRRMLRISWYMKRSNISVLEEIQPKRRLLSHVQSQMMKFLDTLQDEMETPWRKSLCKVVSKGEGSLEDLEPDGTTKSNLWSDAPFMSFTTLSRIVRGGVMLLQSRAVSHDRTVPTDRPNGIECMNDCLCPRVQPEGIKNVHALNPIHEPYSYISLRWTILHTVLFCRFIPSIFQKNTKNHHLYCHFPHLKIPVKLVTCLECAIQNKGVRCACTYAWAHNTKYL